MSEMCESCAAPLSMEEFKGESEKYCKHCSDPGGKLLDREVVRQQIASWFMSWQQGITPEQASIRAAHYMRAMPAWADDF